MAGNDKLYLNNTSMIAMHDAINSYHGKFQDSLYAQYKNAYKLSVSNYFRGDAADAFKEYLQKGQINVITEFLDIAADMKMVIQLFAETFYTFEASHNGKVDENVLDDIKGSLERKETNFNGMTSEITDALSQAARYINVKHVGLESVNEGYVSAYKKLQKINKDLEDTDNSLITTAEELLERIQNLKTLIENVKKHCYNNKEPNPDKMFSLADQNWYEKGANVTLCLLLEEDPFHYAAGEVTIAEDQWAAGLCTDVFAYAGYSFLNASGEAGFEDGTAFAKGRARLLSMNGYAQFTDYLSSKGELRVFYTEGEMKAGISDKYIGLKLEGEAGLLDLEGEVVLGSKELNAFIKGDAKVLTADGKVAFEFEDDGEFAIGFDASADLAEAGIKGGTTILGYKSKDSATGEKEQLLGFGVGVKAEAGVSAALWAESKTAYELEWGNINATTFKVDLGFLGGAEATLTIPTFAPKWPW